MSTLYSISSDTLAGLADAVRQLNGTSAPLSPDDMIDGIEGHVCPSPTIQSLSVTQNGEYTAPSGVDGYSPVTVNVSGGGGVSNIVTGTFVGGAATVDVPYTGTGYPIMTVVEVDGGAYKQGTDWYSLVSRYAIGLITLAKADASSTPDYTSNTAPNKAVISITAKNSATSATAYGRAGDVGMYTYRDTSAAAGAETSFRWVSNTRFVTAQNGTSTSAYGYANGITYRYWVVYSE